jgi:hypothetical protein
MTANLDGFNEFYRFEAYADNNNLIEPFREMAENYTKEFEDVRR